jgi:GT2 family glycosyltransferase
MLGGAVANGFSQNPFSVVSDQIVAYTRAFYQRQMGSAPFFPTSNLAVPARNFRELGGFCESIPSATAEDKEFCQRWRKAGYKTSYVDDALVHHYHELSLSGFLRQQYNYGRGIGFVRTAQTGGARRYAPEPLSFYLGLLTAALRVEGGLVMKIRNTALLFCSQLMLFAGVLKTIIESRSRAGKEEPATVRTDGRTKIP